MTLNVQEKIATWQIYLIPGFLEIILSGFFEVLHEIKGFCVLESFVSFLFLFLGVGVGAALDNADWIKRNSFGPKFPKIGIFKKLVL